MKRLIDRLRQRRWSHLAVANLRILIGFAFVPAGLKKVLRQPFTEPQNSGPFHDFLDAFYATGAFYPFVGAFQLVIAVLLMTQTYAAFGAAMALPVITAITAFCWSTGVVPTATVVTLMLGGTLALLLWDFERWIGFFRPAQGVSAATPAEALIDLGLWRACGIAILLFYGLSCLAYGGVYRPQGADFANPAFYVLQAILLFPIATLLLEQRRRKALPKRRP